MIPALEAIGNIHIPSGVDGHRFCLEALGATKILESNEDLRSRVIGTDNSKSVELYGWAPNVDIHKDSTGYVYLLALNEGITEINAFDDTNKLLFSVAFPLGTVLRLNDNYQHWTIDDGNRICAFVGSYDTPHDYEALTKLSAAVGLLAAGAYYEAPRVREGFRALLPDECLVLKSIDQTETMLLADAKAQGKYIETCAECDKPAVRLDSKWPYFHEHNRCFDHLGASHEL
jgi:hypothetical protein